FDNALRQARLHPPALSPEAKEAETRLQKTKNRLNSDQERGIDLSERLSKAPPSKQDALEADIVQNQADLELDKDEVDDAKEDLMRAGGDLTDRIEALKKKHQEAEGTATALPTGPEPPEQPGLLHRVIQWRELHQKQMQLWQAKTKAETSMALLATKHNTLDAQVDAEKAAIPELAHHSKTTDPAIAALHISAS